MNLENQKTQILNKIIKFVGDKKHPNIDLAIKAIESADCSNFNANSSDIVKQIEFYARNEITELVMLTTFAKLAGASK